MTFGPGLKRNWERITACIAWLAVGLQFYLMMQNKVAGTNETIVRFFSFFTILTNILVAFSFTVLAINIDGRISRFFLKNTVQTAITLYILIVGLVYNTVLRWQWSPQGWQRIADEALHVVTPGLTLIYWVFNVQTKQLRWENAYPWLLYPFIYLLYVMIRGSFSHFYPYFFINADELGYAKAIMNALYVTAAFLGVALLLIWIGRSKKI